MLVMTANVRQNSSIFDEVTMANSKKKQEMLPKGSDKEAKRKALQTAIAQLEKDYGAGTVMKLGENHALEVQAVSTGSISLDLALSIGGVPRGRIIEIFVETKTLAILG